MPTTDPGRLAADLARRLVVALDFAGRVVDDIESAAIGRGTASSAFGAGAGADAGGLAAKVVAETAMLLHVAAPLRTAWRDVDAAVGALAERLIPLARGADVQAALCMDPSNAMDHSMGHVLIGDLGHRDPSFDELLRASLRTGRAQRPERLPHRTLEHEWLERIWPFGMPSPRAHASALAASALGRPLDVLQASRTDIYALTHAVLYASDAGRRPLVASRRRADIGADAAAALGFALDTHDHDLAAEVLWAWPMLGLRWQPAALFAFGRLAEVQDALGFLPGKGFDPERTEGVPSGQARRHILSSCYHATYVFGFLCAAMLMPNRLPPAALLGRKPGGRRGADGGAGSGAAMLAVLNMDDPRSAWCSGLSRQSGERQDEVAPLLLAVALRRAAEQGDLDALRRTLRAAQAAGLEGGPAPAQAAALLMRGQLLAQLLSKSHGHSAVHGAQAIGGDASRAVEEPVQTAVRP
ncbi:MAG: hypothetical protein ABW032_01530 [Burkholderiaceae bacterium]